MCKSILRRSASGSSLQTLQKTDDHTHHHEEDLYNNTMADDAESLVPVPVKDVPEDLICAICHNAPLQPATVEQCDYFFCAGCIRQATSYSTYGGYYSTPACTEPRITDGQTINLNPKIPR